MANNIVEQIKNASPLELATVLEQAELYDKKNTREVIDEIYSQFDNGTNLVDKVVVPIFTSIADGLLESTAATRKLRKKGLTASRIVAECKDFDYSMPPTFDSIPDGYTEWKNIGDQTKADFQYYGDNVRQKYNRTAYEDKNKLDAYKQKKFSENPNSINALDEYTGKKNIYKEKAHPDARRNIAKYKHDHLAEVDHIIPLAQIHKQYKGNYALSDEDIKNIANDESNYALTAAYINRGEGHSGQGSKGEKTNHEFAKEQRRRANEGEANLGLTEQQLKNMEKMHDDSQKLMDRHANQSIGKNLIGKGTADTGKIWGKTAENASAQAKNNLIGNVILFIIKPLYYEISDIFCNGLKEGVLAQSTKEALSLRFGRIKNYLLKTIIPMIKDNLIGFIKSFISSLIEGIISLFVGILRKILKVIKEGVKILVQSGKILFGKNASSMSKAEKGDAIIKIIGGGVLAICGVGIEVLINKIGIPDPWSIVISTMFAGIASALFMLMLDEIDIFSVKAEKRYARIEDVFNERIKDIREAEHSFSTSAIEAMRQQRIEFENIKKAIQNGFNNNNIDTINTNLYKLAKFMDVKLEYSNTSEFVDYIDSTATLEL